MILKTHPNYKNLIGAIFKQESESEWTNQHYLRRKRGGATVIFSTELTEEKKFISKPRRAISNVVTHHLVVARLLFDCHTHYIVSHQRTRTQEERHLLAGSISQKYNNATAHNQKAGSCCRYALKLHRPPEQTTASESRTFWLGDAEDDVLEDTTSATASSNQNDFGRLNEKV